MNEFVQSSIQHRLHILAVCCEHYKQELTSLMVKLGCRKWTEGKERSKILSGMGAKNKNAHALGMADGSILVSCWNQTGFFYGSFCTTISRI